MGREEAPKIIEASKEPIQHHSGAFIEFKNKIDKGQGPSLSELQEALKDESINKEEFHTLVLKSAELSERIEDGLISTANALTQGRDDLVKEREDLKRDGLTGVLDYFKDHSGLDNLILHMNDPEGKRQREISAVMIIMCDLNRFKNINDTYGHSTGDRALRFFATRLTKSGRAGDLVYRKGGDEFILALPMYGDKPLSDEDFAGIKQRLKESVNDGFDFYPYADPKEDSIPMSTSMGFAVIRKGESKSLDATLAEADSDLYRDKVNPMLRE